MSRTILWSILIVGGAAVEIAVLVLGTNRLAVASGIAIVGTWIACVTIQSWYAGIRRHVVAHLGRHWQLGEVLRHPVRTAERVNFQLALDWLQAQSGTPGPFGFHTYQGEEEGQESGVMQQMVALIEGNPEPVSIVWERFPTSPEETMHCASNALYLVRIEQEPVCVLVQGRVKGSSRPATLQVLARNQNAVRTSLDALIRLAREQTVYRGQVLSVERPGGRGTDLVVSFHDLADVDRDAIILPVAVLDTVERNILSFFRHAPALRRTGRGTRHGVLLHGPPGTGKTLVTRYLAGVAGATVLVVSSRQFRQLRPTCQLARLLAPSLVILEDVDLIARDRRRNPHSTLLHELLDEMDGLNQGADVVFLLTTNRPEALEPALAARPGRIDQAIYFPLPDLDCRRRLFVRYGAGLDLRRIDLEPFLQRTEGASPAFLEELCRRAALMAIERGATGEPLPLQTEDLERALRELIESGGPLTRAFLGFPLPGA